MASDALSHALRSSLAHLLPALLGVVLLGAAHAQQPPPTSIFTCVTTDGRRHTSDRPIAACRGVEQRELNSDGSLRRIIPPTLTAEERAAKDAEERRLAAVRQAQLDAVRRDRNLKSRYPDEAAHQRAREAALDTVRGALRSAEQRLEELRRERQPLQNETEFYVGRELPAKLRHQLEANAAAAEAQRSAITAHQAELDRITGLYDAELDRLRKLWAGAPPGSLGPMPSTAVPVSANGRGGSAPR